MLERFYTDLCGTVGLGRTSRWLRHLPWFGGRFQRLHDRQLPPSITAKTRTFDVPALRHAIGSWWCNGNLDAKYRCQMQMSKKIGSAMARAGFGRATHVYSMLGEGGPSLSEAKRRGLTIVSEVYIMLSTERVLAEERRGLSRLGTGHARL